jgi:hypothetical protein
VHETRWDGPRQGRRRRPETTLHSRFAEAPASGTETKCRAESYSKLGGCMSTMPRAEAIGGWRSLS